MRVMKVTKSFIKRGIYYCDFELTDMKLLLKGIVYSEKTGICSFPKQKTEGGKLYSQYCFYDAEVRKNVFSQMSKLMKEVVLPTREEDVSEKKKAAILIDRYRELESKRKEHRKPYAPKKDFKNFREQIKKPESSKDNAGASSCSNPKRNNSDKAPFQMGSGFVEIPLPKRGDRT